jgi:hypothetical protein
MDRVKLAGVDYKIRLLERLLQDMHVLEVRMHAMLKILIHRRMRRWEPVSCSHDLQSLFR